MSGFDTFIADVMAMEGMIGKIKNRMINTHDWSKGPLQSFSNVSAAVDAANSGKMDTKDSYGDKSVRVKLDNIPVEIGSLKSMNADNCNQLNQLLKQSRKIYDVICTQILKEYNDSNGKEGPWAWADQEFAKKSISDIRANIRLNLVSSHVTKDGNLSVV